MCRFKRPRVYRHHAHMRKNHFRTNCSSLFSSKVQNLTVFSIIHMIRIRFFGPGELIQNGFSAAQYVAARMTRHNFETRSRFLSRFGLKTSSPSVEVYPVCHCRHACASRSCRQSAGRRGLLLDLWRLSSLTAPFLSEKNIGLVQCNMQCEGCNG